MACSGCLTRRAKIKFWLRGLIGAASRVQVEKYLKVLDRHQHSEFEKVSRELVNLRDRIGALEVATTKGYKLDTLKDG